MSGMEWMNGEIHTDYPIKKANAEHGGKRPKRIPEEKVSVLEGTVEGSIVREKRKTSEHNSLC
jgi:hypothetical protein